MNKVEPIQIDSIRSLLEEMKNKECSVEWTVYSEIGPGWIGSARIICFYLADRPLSDHPFHDLLKTSLINLLHIPEVSEENIMSGEGEVVARNDRFYLSYWWSVAPPYQTPVESGSGEGELSINHQ